MKEKFLFCNTLSATTTAADIEAIVESFLEANELSWQNFKHICTDGALVMISVRGMASCDVLGLLTTPMRYNIEESASAFDESRVANRP